MPTFNVYGVDQSPWAQAVLLGLNELDIPYRVTMVPPVSTFLQSGVTLPAASVDGEAWFLESDEILQRAGFQPIAGGDRRAVLAAWRGVSHRADSLWRFWRGWSLVHDFHHRGAARLVQHFLRSFVTLYFTVRLRFLIEPEQEPDNYVDQFLYWERRLETQGSDYLGGMEPDMADLMLFGVVQCHSSIPVPPLTALRDATELSSVRAWIGRMQTRFSAYPHLYSAAYFEPMGGQPIRATFVEQTAFWSGLFCMLLLCPITVPLVLYLARRR